MSCNKRSRNYTRTMKIMQENRQNCSRRSLYTMLSELVLIASLRPSSSSIMIKSIYLLPPTSHIVTLLIIINIISLKTKPTHFKNVKWLIWQLFSSSEIVKSRIYSKLLRERGGLNRTHSYILEYKLSLWL